ncbi:MAG: hypothetical protein MdMp014T_0232 [Treponematales bacterium]
MRKVCFLFLFAAGAGSLFAGGNTVFLGVNGFGLTAAYERALTGRFSLAGEATMAMVYGSVMPVYDDGAVMLGGLFSAGFLEVRGRFYPFARRFFVDLGLGYGVMGSISTQISGVLVSPGLGWKFDPSEAGGFVIDLCVCSDWLIGLPPQERETLENGVNPVWHPVVASPLVNIKLLLGYVF